MNQCQLPLLPSGWGWIEARELIDTISAGKSFKCEERPPREGEVGVVKVSAVTWGFYDEQESKTCTRSDLIDPELFVRSGDFLFSRANTIELVGACVIVDRVTRDVMLSDKILRFSVRPGWARWLLWALRSSYGRAEIERLATGNQESMRNIGQAGILSIRIPLPPDGEQHRIIEEIESHVSRLGAAVATLERVERNLERYRASVLKAAVEGRLVPTEAALARQEERDYEPASALLERILAERRRRWAESGKKGKYQEPVQPDTASLPELPEGWSWVALDSVADIQLGQQRAPVHAMATTQLPYIRAANVTWGGLDLTDVKTMGFPNPERYRLERGDLLLSEASGSPMEAGKPAIWRDEIPGACYQKTLLRIRPFDKLLVLPEFLRAIILWDCFAGKFARLAPGVGIVHLTAERMIEWRIPVAPLVEQRRIVIEVAQLESAIESLSGSASKQLLRCQRLRQSILKWAFEGKLADLDPGDEPASVLLERIRAERDAVEPVKVRRAGRPVRAGEAAGAAKVSEEAGAAKVSEEAGAAKASRVSGASQASGVAEPTRAGRGRGPGAAREAGGDGRASKASRASGGGRAAGKKRGKHE